MASAPSGMDPVTGRVDREGRLTQADPALVRLQEDAGSRLGAPIALPQLAAVVRSSMKLGVPLSRSVIAASADQDLDLWIRVEPDDQGATLIIEGWKARPPAPPRLTLVGHEPEEMDSSRSAEARFTTDAELRIVAMDEALADRLGLDRDTVLGQPMTRFFLLMDDGEGMMPMLTAIAGRQDFEGQKARVRGSDKEQPLAMDGTALQPGGKFSGYEVQVVMDGDYAEPAGMFDPALDEALRSPLDHIIAAADRIVDRSEGPLRSDYAAYAGDIAAAGRHLLSVIRSMTEQQEEQAQESDRVDLRKCAAEAIQLVQARAEENSIQIELVGDDGALSANGEARGIVQILVNLLGNAVRHSPHKANIAVILEARGAMAAVTIADEGPGIATENQARIFERYERVGDSPDGIGLGLAISRRLARSMGGDIDLVSQAGEGARFTLLLPSA
jgi:PAS domain-containing protein